MGIVIIPNQVIRFQSSASIDESCDCLGRGFSQLINSNDDTMFQLSSGNEIENGNFESDLSGWETFTPLYISLTLTNETESDACDGEVEITVTGGNAPYTYSLDGTTYQAGNTFTLCEGDYMVFVLDDDGNIETQTFSIVTNIDCSQFANSYANDLVDYEASQLVDCECSAFV
jgi:hypothetical protein